MLKPCAIHVLKFSIARKNDALHSNITTIGSFSKNQILTPRSLIDRKKCKISMTTLGWIYMLTTVGEKKNFFFLFFFSLVYKQLSMWFKKFSIAR